MAQSERVTRVQPQTMGSPGFRVVPREAVTAWCEKNGLVKANKVRFCNDAHSPKPWFRTYPYSSQKRSWHADRTKTRVVLKKPWYLRTPKREWAWLVRPIQFVRERWVAFAAVAVIAAWALMLYSWTQTWLK
jgi:hypothetical protein